MKGSPMVRRLPPGAKTNRMAPWSDYIGPGDLRLEVASVHSRITIIGRAPDVLFLWSMVRGWFTAEDTP